MDDVQTEDVGTETFSGDAPIDETPAAVETAPEPEPEPEPIVPDWLDEVGAPQRQQEPQQPQQEYGYEQRPQYPMQPQYPQVQQQPNPDQILEQFVKDPNGFVSQLVQQRLEQERTQMLGPIAVQLQQMEQKNNAWVQAQANTAISHAKHSVNQAYSDVFSKDEAYRTNTKVRTQVDETLKGMLRQAAERASYGFPDDLMMFSNPQFYPTFLAAAKAFCGYQGQASSPATTRGSRVESATPPQVEDAAIEDLIDADTLEAARRRGPAYMEQLKKAVLETQKKGDYEFWGRRD